MTALQQLQPTSHSLLSALPSGWVGEILDGELVASPRLSVAPARAAFMMGVELGERLDPRRGGNGRWCFLRAPELHLGEDILVPDLAGWRRERVAAPPEPGAAFFTLVPDWVCEVLTPATTALDRARKLPLYARAGVSYVWLVDPVARTLEVYQRLKRGWLLTASHEDDALVRAEPFTSVSLELGSLWLPDAPEEMPRLVAVP
ncbi:Uma2 family endonuclease [Corallococcus sp. CA054B]|uniref:Uma2 family endonuclease n=1 Tax=Corallococcus sp. CA054B TaxID=2316734 RepID=UPI000EA298A1|nr:Uma2 family endonuclease [Corallococcus sp. CA054B]RKG64703.1 Uma2 family endonuclease [Corallococcus sp. CA054B]